MIFLGSICGLLSATDRCVYALSEGVTFENNSSPQVAYKALFTLGDGLQANTIPGVNSGRLYATNLKFKSATNLISLVENNSLYHFGTRAEGTSRGGLADLYTFFRSDTVFIPGDPAYSDVLRTWNFGTVKGNNIRDGTWVAASIQVLADGESASPFSAGSVRVTSTPLYIQINKSIKFKYLKTTSFSASSTSSGADYLRTEVSDMRVWSPTSEPDRVPVVDHYECLIASGKLVKFTADEISFGPLVAGSRPKVTSFLTTKTSM